MSKVAYAQMKVLKCSTICNSFYAIMYKEGLNAWDCLCICMYVHVCDVSICAQIITRHGEGITVTNDAWRIIESQKNVP